LWLARTPRRFSGIVFFPAVRELHPDRSSIMNSPVIAQALAERGMLDAMVAGVTRVQYAVEDLVGPGNGKYVLIGLAIVFALFVFRRRR
jgi:hypothetical protein